MDASAAVSWQEQGNAKGFPRGAQVVTGSGNISSISGRVSFVGDRDMYRICLRAGGVFSATTVGSATFDTQLFLFNSRGKGVYANDDAGTTVQSTLPAGTALTPHHRGTYYLAVSSYDNDPVSPGGEIFPSMPFDAVVGPTGPGGDHRISGWSKNGGSVGTYTIRLTGARVCGSS
jgi:hypothetical protein